MKWIGLRLGRAALLGVLALGLSACGGPAPPTSVVLIVLDTVRADHCSAWGYERQTPPNLDAFLEGAVQFERAYSTSSWTLPSHASMFTGQHPYEHGAHALRIADSGPNRIFDRPLKPEAITLAERLRTHGYDTAAFAANTVYLTEHYQVNQGFDTYHVEKLKAPEVVDLATDWLDARPEKPFFLFLNFIDAHWPYNTDRVEGVVDGPVSDDPEIAEQFRQQVLPGTNEPDPMLAQAVTEQYDMGIANADRGVGLLIAHLKESGRFENTLFVVTSDHGEFLGEHRLSDHSKDVYEPVLWVPLAVKHAGQRYGRKNSATVSVGQIYATALEAVGLEVRDAMPALPARETESGGAILAELYYSRNWDVIHATWGHRFDRVRSVLYDWPWKFIHSSDAEHALYQLEEDPEERDNRLHVERDRVKTMETRLRAMKVLEEQTVAPPPGAEGPLPAELEEQMRALGYLGDVATEERRP